jgi:hypothetical protein
VRSGGGLHCYWRLVDVVMVGEQEPALRRALRGLAVILGGDLSAAEPAHVLRLPGTLNGKPEYGTPRPVVLELCAPTRCVSLEAVLAVVPPDEESHGKESGPFRIPEEIPQGQRHRILFRYARA